LSANSGKRSVSAASRVLARPAQSRTAAVSSGPLSQRMNPGGVDPPWWTSEPGQLQDHLGGQVKVNNRSDGPTSGDARISSSVVEGFKVGDEGVVDLAGQPWSWGCPWLCARDRSEPL
jgi:hypothetical protein